MVDIRVPVGNPSNRRGQGASPRRKGSSPRQREGSPRQRGSPRRACVCLGERVFSPRRARGWEM